MRQKTSLIIAACLGAAVALPLAALPALEAAIPVVDIANINQQNLTYLQTVKTVLNTAQQITLQLQELQSLPGNTLNSYRSMLDQEVGAIKTSLTNTSGVLNPQNSLASVWNTTFNPAGTITAANFSGATASAVNNSTISALNQANYDSFNVVKSAVNNLDQTQTNLDQLMTLNSSAEGQKQTGQVNNMLLAEQAKLLQQQNLIRAAEASAQISYYERQNQIHALQQADADRAAAAIDNMNTDVPVFQ